MKSTMSSDPRFCFFFLQKHKSKTQFKSSYLTIALPLYFRPNQQCTMCNGIHRKHSTTVGPPRLPQNRQAMSYSRITLAFEVNPIFSSNSAILQSEPKCLVGKKRPPSNDAIFVAVFCGDVRALKFASNHLRRMPRNAMILSQLGDV